LISGAHLDTRKTTANHPLNGVPHAHMRDSTESTSASSRSLFISFSVGFFPWLHRQLTCSSHRLESSGSSSSNVSKFQSSPKSIFGTESRSMDLSYSNERLICACGGVNGVTFRFIVQSYARQPFHQLLESLRFTANSVFFRRAKSTPSSADHRLDSVRLIIASRSYKKNRMSVGEPHEHGRTTFAYEYPMHK
jgi:hypothetical protein